MMAMDRDFLDCVDGIHGRLCRLEGMHGVSRLELRESFLVGLDDAKGGIHTTYVQKVDTDSDAAIEQAKVLMVLRFSRDARQFRDTLAMLKRPPGFDILMKTESPDAEPDADKVKLYKFQDIIHRARSPHNSMTPAETQGLQYAAYLLLADASKECVRYAIEWCIRTQKDLTH